MRYFKSKKLDLRFYQTKRVILVLLILLLLVAAAIAIGNATKIGDSLPFLAKLGDDFGGISALINSFLTLLLLLTTGIYAWFTYLMMRAMSSQNKIATVPNIFISVKNSRFEINGSLVELHLAFDILNCGQGVAINLGYKKTYLHAFPFEGSKEYATDFKFIPISPYSTSGSVYSHQMTVTSTINELPKRIEEYLMLNISYKDIRRNIYQINQYYNVSVTSFSDGTPHLYLYLKAEIATISTTTAREWETNMQGKRRTFGKERLLWKHYY